MVKYTFTKEEKQKLLEVLNKVQHSDSVNIETLLKELKEASKFLIDYNISTFKDYAVILITLPNTEEVRDLTSNFQFYNGEESITFYLGYNGDIPFRVFLKELRDIVEAIQIQEYITIMLTYEDGYLAKYSKMLLDTLPGADIQTELIASTLTFKATDDIIGYVIDMLGRALCNMSDIKVMDDKTYVVTGNLVNLFRYKITDLSYYEAINTLRIIEAYAPVIKQLLPDILRKIYFNIKSIAMVDDMYVLTLEEPNEYDETEVNFYINRTNYILEDLVNLIVKVKPKIK